MRVMKASDGGPTPLVCFCEVVSRDPFFLIGRRRSSTFRLTDLPSLRFAAVSEVPTPWQCLQHDLREAGVDPSGLARAPDKSMAENFAALAKGEIDVMQAFEPFATLAARQGAGDILYAASARGPTVYTTFITTRRAIARDRVAFAALTRAMGRMLAWLAEHAGEELAETTAPFFPDVARDVLASALERYRQAKIWARTPDVSRQGFARLGQSLLSGGFISRMPVYEECVEQGVG